MAGYALLHDGAEHRQRRPNVIADARGLCFDGEATGRPVALAALRGPDHNKLVPFRFVIARGEGLERLAELFVDYGRRRGKTGEVLEAERVRAMQAPVVVAVIARIDAPTAKTAKTCSAGSPWARRRVQRRHAGKSILP